MQVISRREQAHKDAVEAAQAGEPGKTPLQRLTAQITRRAKGR